MNWRKPWPWALAALVVGLILAYVFAHPESMGGWVDGSPPGMFE